MTSADYPREGDATFAWATSVVDIISDHVTPFCSTESGSLPFREDLVWWFCRGELTEWTIDTIGRRDWKIDTGRDGKIKLRYRGDDPSARVAVAECNAALAEFHADYPREDSR